MKDKRKKLNSWGNFKYIIKVARSFTSATFDIFESDEFEKLAKLTVKKIHKLDKTVNQIEKTMLDDKTLSVEKTVWYCDHCGKEIAKNPIQIFGEHRVLDYCSKECLEKSKENGTNI